MPERRKTFIGLAVFGASVGAAIAAAIAGSHAAAIEAAIAGSYAAAIWPIPYWIAALIIMVLGAAAGGAAGALLGYSIGRDRPRNCPQCGQPMGPPSNEYVFRRIKRASPVGRLPDDKLLVKVDDGLDYLPHSFYLCTNCDKEFLAPDLATQAESGCVW